MGMRQAGFDGQAVVTARRRSCSLAGGAHATCDMRMRRSPSPALTSLSALTVGSSKPSRRDCGEGSRQDKKSRRRLCDKHKNKNKKDQPAHDEVEQPVGRARLHNLGFFDCPTAPGMAGAAEEAQSQAGPRVGKQSRAAAGL